MKEINVKQAAVLTSPNPLVLVCTKKENGELNMAPVSLVMYASFNPPIMAFAMGKASNSGKNVRENKKAVIVLPGTSLKDVVKTFGSTSGNEIDKLKENPLELQDIEGSDIKVPKDIRAAFVVSLKEMAEAGDHYLYICDIDKIFGDESKEALLAWNGYSKLAPAKEAE